MWEIKRLPVPGLTRDLTDRGNHSLWAQELAVEIPAQGREG